MKTTQEPQADTPVVRRFQEGFCAPENRRFVLIATVLASALGFIDGTVVAIALPAMRASLDAGLTEAQWIHNAYMLTLSALILVGGAMGDRFGLARVFSLGIGLFVLASLSCAMATSPLILILSRALQGIGAAIMVPGSLAIIACAYPREERGRAIGIWAAAASLTTAMGPIIGGLALTLGGPEMWRWIFAINLPLGALTIWLLHTRTERDLARPETPIDLLGAATVTLSLLALAWGLTAADHGSPDLRWIFTGAAGLMLFLWVEARQRDPMLPLSLFRSRVFSAANLFCVLIYGALAIMFFFMPMTFIAGWGYSEIEASAAFAPMSIFVTLLSPAAGRWADRFGPAPLLGIGSLCVAAGYGLMGWLAPAMNLWGHILPAMGLVGIGMALVSAPVSTAVMGSVDESRSGIASGINNAVSRMAGLIAVAAVGGLTASLYTNAGGTASFGVLSDSPNHITAMTSAFTELAYLSAALCLIGALLALLIRTSRAAA